LKILKYKIPHVIYLFIILKIQLLSINIVFYSSLNFDENLSSWIQGFHEYGQTQFFFLLISINFDWIDQI